MKENGTRVGGPPWRLCADAGPCVLILVSTFEDTMNQTNLLTHPTGNIRSLPAGGGRIAFVQSCWHKEIVDQCRIAFVTELERLWRALDRGACVQHGLEKSLIQAGFVPAEIAPELRGDELIRIDVPTDANMSVHREWLLIRPRTDWYTGSAEYVAGSLLAANYDEFLAGTAQLQVVFEPGQVR